MSYLLRKAIHYSCGALFICAGLAGHAVQAAATFNSATGELVLPAVMVNWENSFHAMTLKRATPNAPLTLGDEFEIKSSTPNATPEERNSNFLYASNTAYVPDVRVNTPEGEKSYRLLLQFTPQKGTLRVSSMEDATVYSTISGEPNIASYFQRLQQQISQAEMPVTCSNASLYGIYGYGTGGTREVNGQWYNYYEIGVNYFDGMGTVYNVSTDTLNYLTQTIAGTYSVASNCQAKMSYAGNDFYFFTPPMGDKFYFTQAAPLGGVTVAPQSAWMERQSKGLETGCSIATLKGTYAYGAKGVKESRQYTESGLESYDGKGNVTNIYTDTLSGQTQYTKGTYTMTDYCDALVTYESGDAYLMHVAPDGESMPFIQYAGLKDGEMFGGYERRVSMMSNTFTSSTTSAITTESTATTRRTRTTFTDKCPIGYIGTPPLLCKPDYVDMSFCNQPAPSQYRKELDLLAFPPEERCVRNVPQYGQCESGYTLSLGYCQQKASVPAITTTAPEVNMFAMQPPPEPIGNIQAKIDSSYTSHLGAANNLPPRASGTTREECAKKGLGFIVPRCEISAPIPERGTTELGTTERIDAFVAKCKQYYLTVNYDAYTMGNTLYGGKNPTRCVGVITDNESGCKDIEKTFAFAPKAVSWVAGNSCDDIAPGRAVQAMMP